VNLVKVAILVKFGEIWELVKVGGIEWEVMKGGDCFFFEINKFSRQQCACQQSPVFKNGFDAMNLITPA
jgi:hypothetical protein